MRKHTRRHQYVDVFFLADIRCVAKKSQVYAACEKERVQGEQIYIQDTSIQLRGGHHLNIVWEMPDGLREGISRASKSKQRSREMMD